MGHEASRQRRQPEDTVLYRVVQSGWATSKAQLAASERYVPQFCRRELDAFLRCGILAHGFARVWCQACRQDDVVAFSCKGRGFCPSCGGRRMAATAAHLVDHVIPDAAPVRQWVLSLPYRVRFVCAHDPAAFAAVRRILVRAVSGYYERAAARLGKPRPRAGAVAFVQRFDSGLRLNVHFHVIWLDGVYSHEPGRGGVEWCRHAQVTDADVALLVRRVRNRVRRKLRQMGKWPEDRDAADAEVGGAPSDGEQLLLELDAAAVQGVALSGERAGQRDVRVGRGTRDEPFVKGPLCADLDGFSLHGAVRVAAGDRKRLEHLCRYAGRPAIAESRLSRLPDGRVAYSLKKTWRDGSTHVVLEPQVLIERLLALVPRPRRHLVTYHGVLAPGASLRHRVVPRVDEAGEQEGLDEDCADPEEAQSDEVAAGSVALSVAGVPHRPSKWRRAIRRYYTWAELLRRVFHVEIFTCPNCGGVRRLLAAIQDPSSIERVLRAMGLPFEAPELAVARAPPDGGGSWLGA